MTITLFNRSAFVQQVHDAISSPEGFVHGLQRRRAFATKLCQDYQSYSPSDKKQLLLAFASELGDPGLSAMIQSLPKIQRLQLASRVTAAALWGSNVKTSVALRKRLQRGLVPIPEQFFILVGSVPLGTSFLIKLRGDLLTLLNSPNESISKTERTALEALDANMQDLFATQSGAQFKQIGEKALCDSETTEFLKTHERVHPIRSVSNDLSNRLTGLNRITYGLFLSSQPKCPLVFVEAILTTSLPSSVSSILDTRDTKKTLNPTHATFYSVSNAYTGLRGLNLASQLLFLSIERLSATYQTCQVFATLSPVPGFTKWLKSRSLSSILSATKIKKMALSDTYYLVLQTPKFQPYLESICGTYLLFERTPELKLIDPVANFHVQNGAQVERINSNSDLSRNGRESSFGIMVNYRYNMKSVPSTSISYRQNACTATSFKVFEQVTGCWEEDYENLFKALNANNAFEKLDISLYAKSYTKSGEFILKRGDDTPSYIYYISMGSVVVKSLVTQELRCGDVFGYEEILLNEPTRYDVVTTSNHCHVFLLRKEDFSLLLRNSKL